MVKNEVKSRGRVRRLFSAVRSIVTSPPSSGEPSQSSVFSENMSDNVNRATQNREMVQARADPFRQSTLSPLFSAQLHQARPDGNPEVSMATSEPWPNSNRPINIDPEEEANHYELPERDVTGFEANPFLEPQTNAIPTTSLETGTVAAGQQPAPGPSKDPERRHAWRDTLSCRDADAGSRVGSPAASTISHASDREDLDDRMNPYRKNFYESLTQMIQNETRCWRNT